MPEPLTCGWLYRHLGGAYLPLPAPYLVECYLVERGQREFHPAGEYWEDRSGRGEASTERAGVGTGD